LLAQLFAIGYLRRHGQGGLLKPSNIFVPALDTAVAEREDLDFIKFYKKFSSVLCQAMLFKGLDHSGC